MSALKEFANFILLNVANLAATYDRLLAENGGSYPALPADSRMTAARRLIKTAAEACEAETPDPLHHLFETRTHTLSLELSPAHLPQPLAEIECLGQTLTPVVTNLEAGKFLWQMLADVRAANLRRIGSFIPSSSPLLDTEIGAIPALAENAQAQKQLRILSLAVEQSPSVVIITNNQGQIEYVNPKFSQTTGYTSAEAIGRNPNILKSGKTSGEEYKQLWQAISSGQEWQGELYNKKKNGELYWVASHISPIKDSTGGITHYLSIQEDITERKQTEEQLRKLSLAVEQSINTVVITDTDGYIEYVNPKFTETTGYTRQEAIGQHTRILKSGVTSSDAYKNMWETIVAGVQWQGELCNKKKNGELYWEFTSISPIKDEKGVTTHFLAVKEEITARKRAEEGLKRLIQQNQLILQSVEEGIIGVDVQGIQTFVNPAAAKMLGYEVEELVGQPSHAIWHYAKADGTFYPVEECPTHITLTKGTPHLPVDNEVFWRRDGTSFPVEYHSTPIHEDDKLVGAVVAFRDISKRKQAEQMVKESQQRLSLLVAQSPLAVIEWNLAFEVVEWNQAAENIFGYTREEALGRHAAGLLVPEEAKPMVDQVWQELLTQQGGTHSTNENFTKDGHIISCEWHNTLLIGAQGQVIGVASLVADITERKQLEQQIQQSLARLSGQIQAITEVAQQISGTLTLENLFQQVVDLIQTQFGYYHAQIYTLEEGDMVLQAGTGEVGRRLKESNHKISLSAEQSLVIRAMWEGEPVLVPDVSQEPTWLPNPLLPETKAELTVPIALGAEVIGVLDVQSDKLNGLDEEDRLLLIGLCGQVAIAIETRRAEVERTRLLAETERHARREQTIREITEQMRAANNLEQLVKITARELGQRLSAGHAIVELGIEAESQDTWAVQNLSNNGH